MSDLDNPLPRDHSHACTSSDKFNFPIEVRREFVKIGRVRLLWRLAQLPPERLHSSNKLEAILVGSRDQRFELPVLLVLVHTKPAFHLRHEVIPTVNVVGG
jgi:hypothetical protein